MAQERMPQCEKSKAEQFSREDPPDHQRCRARAHDEHRAPHGSVRHDGRAARRRASAHIAEAAWLNERYVREWLGAMVTGGIVELRRCD